MSSVEELCDHIALINQSRKILEGRVKDIKKAYKSNEFEITFSNSNGDVREFLSPGMELMGINKEEENFIARVRIQGNFSPNDLLLMFIPHVEVHAMHEIIPTMNEIFITAVNEDKEGKKHPITQ